MTRTFAKRSQTNWLTIFADLAALLLSFFVLTFSMGTLRQGDFEQLSSSFLARTEIGDRKDQHYVADELSVSRQQDLPPISADYLAALLQARLAESGLASGYRLASPETVVEITLEPGLLQSGATDWTDQGRAIAELVLGFSKQERLSVEIFIAPKSGEDTATALDRSFELADRLLTSNWQPGLRVFSLSGVVMDDNAAVVIQLRSSEESRNG